MMVPLRWLNLQNRDSLASRDVHEEQGVHVL